LTPQNHRSVLDTYVYQDAADIRASLKERVIDSTEAWAQALRECRQR